MTSPPLALSQRQAARLLGLGRDTVRQLVKRGLLREVPWGRSRRLPRADVEELARTGWTAADAKPTRPRRRRAAPRVIDPEALLNLDLGSLP